jgi:hypothetical protein
MARFCRFDKRVVLFELANLPIRQLFVEFVILKSYRCVQSVTFQTYRPRDSLFLWLFF